LRSTPFAWFASFLVIVAGFACAADADPPSSVVKLTAIAMDGTISFGSAVVVSKNQLATACHVIRDARTVEIRDHDRVWTAKPQDGSLHEDVCMLAVTEFDLPPVQLRPSSELRMRDKVVAVGFPGGGNQIITVGEVLGLYRYHGGNVIRTSSEFDFGASGGALFDEAGNLVGLLAFKSRRDGALRFAVPSEWVFQLSAGDKEINATSIAFWEESRDRQPAFLQAAVLEATGQRMR
jgi:S1-C subfamily serine protease